MHVVTRLLVSFQNNYWVYCMILHGHRLFFSNISFLEVVRDDYDKVDTMRNVSRGMSCGLCASIIVEGSRRVTRMNATCLASLGYKKIHLMSNFNIRCRFAVV
ncbi:hypothetical protein V6Z12_A01G004100 [Gossypium hirsutum]